MGDNTFHAALSPSGRHRWGACPGSIREEAKYPEKEGGHAANDGTRTHSLLERALIFEFVEKQGQCGPAPFIFETITDEFGKYTVDADRSARVNVALEYIRRRVAEEGTTAIPERRVHPDGLVGRADMSGTVDCQIPGKEVYEVIDFKDGMSPVVAENNPQLEQYAMGVLAELPQENYPYKFRLTVIQPKMALKGLPAITSYDLTTTELFARVEVIKAQAAATENPNAPLVPGEAQCKYCRAKGSCSALAGKSLSEVGLTMFPFNPAATAVTPDVMPAGFVDPATQAAQRDPNKMDAAELVQLMEAAPLVRAMLDGVEKEIQRRLEARIPVPGYKLVRGTGRRAWALPEEDMVKKLTGMGIPKSALYEQTLVSPAKAEKLVWDKKGEAVKLTDRQIKSMNSEYVTTTPGKITIAPESDPRPSVVIDAAELFAPVGAPAAPVGAPAAPPAGLPSFFGAAAPVVEAPFSPLPDPKHAALVESPPVTLPAGLPSFFQ